MAGARRVLPDAFGTRFALFGDAEEEFDWHGPFRRDAVATTAMSALPQANARFLAAGLKPCWLADYPIVADDFSRAILAQLVVDGGATVGSQLHPWVTPPFDEDVSTANSYTGNLPETLQDAKLAALTAQIEAAVGVRPIIYRAGRYGIGAHTANILARHGYRLDVSVRARFDYVGQGGPDFTEHPVWPWAIGPGLHELPLSTGYTGALRRFPALHRSEHLRGTMANTGLLARVPLTPEGVPLADARKAVDSLLDEGVRLFSLSFHTPSLVAGHTPYVRDAADLRAFWRWWDGMFAHFAQRGVTPVDSDAIIHALEAA